MLVASTEIKQFLFDSRNWRQKKFHTRRVARWYTLQIQVSILWRQFLAPVSGACVIGLTVITQENNC